MPFAKAILAFPEKIFKSFDISYPFLDYKNRMVKKHQKQWLGRQDSNLGMRDPKSRDLPLVDAPNTKKSKALFFYAPACAFAPAAPSACFANSFSYSAKTFASII